MEPTKEVLFGARDQYQKVYTLDSGLSVARGWVPGTKGVDKFGRNAAVPSTGEDIWDGSTVYGGWLATAEAMTIVSGSTDDGPGLAGALTVEVFGLDSSYDEISETVTLNGDTPVALANSYIRVNRALVATAGATQVNIGAITITSDTDGSSADMAIISAGNGQTLMSVYTVPRNYDARLVYASISMADTAKQLVGKLFVRPYGGAWNVKRSADVKGGDRSLEMSRYPITITEKSDIRWYAEVDVAAEVTATFTLILDKIGE